MTTNEKPLVIGFCGGTGSGKTTLAKRLHDAIGGGCAHYQYGRLLQTQSRYAF